MELSDLFSSQFKKSKRKMYIVKFHVDSIGMLFVVARRRKRELSIGNTFVSLDSLRHWNESATILFLLIWIGEPM